MNRFFSILILFFGLTSLNAQIHEIGGFVGGSNFIGDIGKTDYVAPNEFAFGILYKWNKSPRHAWRISLTQARITGNDKDSKVPARLKRGYDFENQIREVSAGLEFNFFNFNLHDFGPKFTPYIYTGLSYISYDGLFFLDKKPKIDNTRHSLSIPITLGVKTRIMDHLILGFESSAKFTFKDDLDGSNSSNDNLEPLKFGNINSKDWYVFTGFTLTYTYGNKPCYCRD
jgi:Domain of unknown function (DUF6089)